MKFITSILTLLTATSAIYAVPVDESTASSTTSATTATVTLSTTGAVATATNATNTNLRGTLDDKDTVIASLSQECKAAIQKSDEFMQCYFCDSYMNINNVKESCKLLKSEKCQNFYKNPMSYAPACSSNTKFADLLSTIEVKTAQIDAFCQLDGNGKLCKISQVMLEKKGFDTGEIIDNCESKICTQKYVNLFKLSDKYSPKFAEIYPDSYKDNEKTDLSGLKPFIKFMESEECTADHVDDVAKGKLAYEVNTDVVTQNYVSGAMRNSGTVLSVLSIALLLKFLF